MDKDYNFAVEIYKKYKHSYENLLAQSESIKDYSVVWSDFGFEFYPFQDFIDFGIKKPAKIYKNKPDGESGYIESRFIENEIYYAFNPMYKTSGAVFIVDNNGDKISLKFDEEYCGEEEKVFLHYFCLLVYKDEKIDKVLNYLNKESEEHESFYSSQFLYNADGKIDMIVRDGKHRQYSKELITVPTFRYRFEYVDGKTLIYHKQLKPEETEEKLIFSKK